MVMFHFMDRLSQMFDCTCLRKETNEHIIEVTPLATSPTRKWFYVLWVHVLSLRDNLMASEYSQSFDSSGPIVNCLRAIRAKCIGPASACFMGYVEMLHARKNRKNRCFQTNPNDPTCRCIYIYIGHKPIMSFGKNRGAGLVYHLSSFACC